VMGQSDLGSPLGVVGPHRARVRAGGWAGPGKTGRLDPSVLDGSSVGRSPHQAPGARQCLSRFRVLIRRLKRWA
jgi:hypothetical protein